MADVSVRTIVVRNDFQAIAARMRIEAANVVDETAKRIAADEKRRATPGLAPTIHIKYRGALRADVIAGNRKKFHAGFIEFGTIDRPASPFAIPAAEGERAQFMRSMKKIVRAAR